VAGADCQWRAARGGEFDWTGIQAGNLNPTLSEQPGGFKEEARLTGLHFFILVLAHEVIGPATKTAPKLLTYDQVFIDHHCASTTCRVPALSRASVVGRVSITVTLRGTA
jgi:hypothetical protein